MRSRWGLVGAIAWLAASGGLALADVRIVDASGNGEYETIQEAVNAAVSGDTLLVRPGSYAGFTITHKGLTLVTDGDVPIEVDGDVLVRDLAAWHEVSLANLALVGSAELLVRDCEGSVRARSCSALAGFPAAQVLRCEDVALVDCTFVGRGGTVGGGNGGDGLTTTDSSVALYGCYLAGGEGADGADGDSCFGGSCSDGGLGGDGLQKTTAFVFAADCHFEGAPGGEGGVVDGTCDCDDGPHGAAIRGSGTPAVLLDCTTAGPVHGDVEQLTGRARRIELPALVTELEQHALVCYGAPGDRVRVLAAPRGGFEYVPDERGVDLLGQRFSQETSAATGPATFGALHFATVQAVIPASGVLELPLRVLELPDGDQAALHHVQALFGDVGGQVTWSDVAVTDALSGSAFVVDCPASECPAPSLVHVDDDAPGDPGPGDASVGDPDEDGSAEHPFDSLLEAIVTVADGGEILVQDGYYAGPANTNIGLLGRELTIRSVNGPASCVLDAAGGAHVLSFVEGEPEGTLLQGLTLTGASAGGVVISQSSPTIDRCWIVGNSSASSGAGLQIGGGSPRITRCTIAGNVSEYVGGGLSVGGSGDDEVLVQSCTIVENVAQNVGGVSTGAELLRLESCTIARNSGVGVQIVSTSFGASDELRLRNCVLWDSEIASLRIYGAGARLYVDYSDVEGGERGVLDTGLFFWGEGNLDLDPRFVDPLGGDYHLQEDSPCIDAGDPAFVPEPGETDIDGDSRELDFAIDMGSDETFRDCNANGLPDSEEGLSVDSPVFSPFGAGAPGEFTVPSPPRAQGPVLLELWASADLGDQNERVTVRVNGHEFGSVFSSGGQDCPFFEDRATLVIPAAGFNAAVAGGDALVTLLPSSTVDPDGCALWDSFVYLSLHYDGDCDGDGVLDACELAAGTELDANGNGVPDSCE